MTQAVPAEVFFISFPGPLTFECKIHIHRPTGDADCIWTLVSCLSSALWSSSWPGYQILSDCLSKALWHSWSNSGIYCLCPDSSLGQVLAFKSWRGIMWTCALYGESQFLLAPNSIKTCLICPPAVSCQCTPHPPTHQHPPQFPVLLLRNLH